MHDSRAVANEMLEIAREEGVTLTPMQLIKLVFFAQGWSLGLRGKRLFAHDVSAWQYGPVVSQVYWAFNKFGRSPINEKATDEHGLPYRGAFTADERRLLRSVVRGYGTRYAYTLSNMTHEPGTPWSKTYRPGMRNRIPIDVMQDYFERLAARRRH